MPGRPISMFSMRWRAVLLGHLSPHGPRGASGLVCLLDSALQLPFSALNRRRKHPWQLPGTGKATGAEKGPEQSRRPEFQTSYVSPCKPSCLPRTHVPWSTPEWSGHPADLSHCPVRPWYQVWRSFYKAVHLAVKAKHTQPDPSLATPSDTLCCVYKLFWAFTCSPLFGPSYRGLLQSHVGLQVSLLYGDVILPLQTRTLHSAFSSSLLLWFWVKPLSTDSAAKNISHQCLPSFLMLYFHYESKSRCSYNCALRKTLKFIHSLLNLNMIRFIKNSQIHSPETFSPHRGKSAELQLCAGGGRALWPLLAS